MRAVPPSPSIFASSSAPSRLCVIPPSALRVYLLLIPGLNRILPAIDQNKKTILEGYAQPNAGHLRLPGGRHDRLREYDAAVLDARDRGVGIQSPEGFAQYQPERPYTPKPPKDETLLDRVSLYLGLGLMTSGQSGVFKALEGERSATRTSPAIPASGTGAILAQTWNAGPALAAAYEYYVGGTSNTGRVYRLPPNYATDYELRTR